MKTTNLNDSRFLMMALPLALAACSSSDSSSDGGETGSTQDISIQFAAQANGSDISCGEDLTGLGLAGSDASLKDFRFYVHGLEVSTDQGRTLAVELEENIWQQESVALLDFQDRADACDGDAKDTHTAVTGQVALQEGERIDGLQFTLGVPEALNHQDQAAAQTPLNIQSLFWSWQVGYKHVRVDMAPTGGIVRPTDGGFVATTFNFHLGSTNCEGNPQAGEAVSCERSNRPLITLDGYDPESSTVVFDYGQLVAASNLGQDEAGPAGCMSGSTDPECEAIFEALGMDVESGDMDAALTQGVFRLD